MNTRNRISLLLAAILVVALLVVGMTLTTSAAEGDLVTEYGVVPAANANDNFAIFHKAEGAENYTFVKSVADAFKDAAWEELQTHTGHFVVVALRNSTITAGENNNFSNFVSMKADLTFDLDGKTVNASFSSTTTKNFGLFWITPVAVTEDTERNILVENGTITLNRDNVVYVANPNNNILTELTVNLTFRNVKFDQADGTNTDQPIVQPNKSTTNMITNILFDECTFDVRGRKTDSAYYLHAGYRGNGYAPLNYTVKGGEILIDSATNFVMTLGTVNFEDGINGPTKLTTTADISISDVKLNHNTLTVGYYKEGSDANHNYYRLPSLNTEYGAIPTTYANIERYPFVIFTKATGSDTWTVHSTQADATNSEPKLQTPFGDSIYTSYRYFKGDVVILMRRDVDYTAHAGFSNGFRMYANVTYDLNGYTLTSSNNAEAFFNLASKTIEASDDATKSREYTFKNGTIVTKDKPFMLLKAQQDLNATGIVINVAFNNITFDRAEGATKEQPFVQVGFVDEGKEYSANVVYNDCTFDIRGAIGSAGVYLFSISSSHKTLTYKSLLHLTQTVNGGKILADVDTNKVKLYIDGRPNGSTLTINEGSNGEPLQLVLPAGTENQFIKGGDSTADLVNIPGAPHAYSYWKSSTDGVNDTYNLVPYWMTTSQAIPKTSVTLSTDLIYNIYLPTGRVTAAKINGEAVDLKNAPKVTLDNGLTYWHITVKAGLLGACEEIELVTTVDVGSEVREDATRKINIIKYAKNVLAANLGETTDKLAKDMLAYVKAACVYAGNQDETIDAIDAILGNYAVAPEMGEAVQSTDGLASAALLLNDKPAFVFFPELENGEAKYDLNAYKFSVNGLSLSAEITEVNGKTALVVYTYAYAMCETINYTIEGTEISGAYNLAAYLNGVKDNANTAALVKALYQYSLTAKAYKAEKTA